jgi:hypothetical protein
MAVNINDLDDDDYTDDGYAGDDTDAGRSGTSDATDFDAPDGDDDDDDDDEPGYAGDSDDDDDDQHPADSGNDDPLSDLYAVAGFADGLVTLDDQQVPFNQLSSEERRNVLSQAFEDEYQRGRAEANPEEGLDEQEIALVNHFRTNGTTEGFELTSGLESLSAEELHRRDIIARDPEATSEEIEEELTARRGLSNFEKRAGQIRTGLESQAVAQRTQAQQTAAREYSTAVRTAVTSMKDIEGFPLDASGHDFIQRELTEAGEDGLAPFFRDLANPAVQGRLAFLNRMFPSIVEGFEKQVKEAFEEGKRVALGKGAPRRLPTQQTAAPASRNARGRASDDDVIGDYGHRR